MKTLHQYSRNLIWLGVAALASANSNAALMEEVQVTAQKRAQNIQDVPIAINAITGDQMQQLGFTNAQQVAAMSPGVSTVQPNGEANYSIGVRGVSSNDFVTNVESPVAMYVDEVYISQMSGSGFALFDMERVEILKGPQGTLFGRNATGGLAHFITKKPTEDKEGYFQATVGRYEQIKLEGALSGPLSETLSARISFATHDNDGYAKNRYTGETLNNANDAAGRLQFLYTPSDTLEALVSIRAGEQDIRTGFFEYVSANDEFAFTPGELNNVIPGYSGVGGESFDPYDDTDGDVYTGDYDLTGFNRLETRGYSLKLSWDVGEIGITSITDYSSVEREYMEDSDATPANFWHLTLSTDAEQFSQELRIDGSTDKFDWVTGFYYLDVELNDHVGATSESFYGTGDDVQTGVYSPYTTETESWSVFGQVDYHLTSTVTLTAGLRFINDDKTHHYENTFSDFPNGTPFNGPREVAVVNGVYDGSRTDEEFAARLALSWQVSDNILLYGSVNRGFKSGGYNSPIDPLPGVDDYNLEPSFTYDPEELDAFEVGFKSDLLDGMLVLNGSAYYYDYKNYQAFTFIGIASATINADADARGGELELQANPIEGLDIILGAAYNDIEASLVEPDGSTTDFVPTQAPEWNLSGLVRYEWEGFGGILSVQADVDYRDEVYFSVTNFDTVRQGSFAVWNASVGYRNDQQGWSVFARVENLADEEYQVQAFDLSGPAVFGMVEQYYGRPRWTSVSFNYEF